MLAERNTGKNIFIKGMQHKKTQVDKSYCKQVML